MSSGESTPISSYPNVPSQRREADGLSWVRCLLICHGKADHLGGNPTKSTQSGRGVVPQKKLQCYNQKQRGWMLDRQNQGTLTMGRVPGSLS